MTARLFRLLFEFATGTLLASMAVLTALDVIGRYLFNRPLRGAFELTEVLMAALIFAALPLVTMRTEHIVVDLIDPYLGARVRRIHGRVIQFASGGVMAVLAYVLFQQAAQAARDGLYTDALQLPISPIIYVGAVAFLVAAVVHLALAFVRRPGGGDRNEPRR